MAWGGLAILNALADGPKLTRQLTATLDGPANSLRRCLRSLAERGLVTTAEGAHQITDKGRRALSEGREVTSGPCSGNAASRRGPTLRQRAWRLMRIRDGFSVEDLLSTLCDGNEGDPEANLSRYVSALAKGGYLTPLRRRGEGGAKRWCLRRDRNTGPEAPAYNTRTRCLTDCNTGEVIAFGGKPQEAGHAR